MGANLASNRLIPVGAGKAISNSISSPSPFTFTTVPTPHFLCTALSPAFHPAFSAPVVIFLAAAFLLGVCFFTGFVGEPTMPFFVFSIPYPLLRPSLSQPCQHPIFYALLCRRHSMLHFLHLSLSF